MFKNIAAIATSLICFAPLSVVAHSSDATGISDRSPLGQGSIAGYSGFSAGLTDNLIILNDLQYKLAAPVVSRPGDVMPEFDCVCAGGSAGALGAAFTGGAFGFFGTGGNAVGGMIGEAIGAAVGVGLHEGYHYMQENGAKPGVEHIELDGMTIQAD